MYVYPAFPRQCGSLAIRKTEVIYGNIFHGKQESPWQITPDVNHAFSLRTVNGCIYLSDIASDAKFEFPIIVDEKNKEAKISAESAESSSPI